MPTDAFQLARSELLLENHTDHIQQHRKLLIFVLRQSHALLHRRPLRLFPNLRGQTDKIRIDFLRLFVNPLDLRGEMVVVTEILHSIEEVDRPELVIFEVT